MNRLLAITGALAALTLAACGDDGSSDPSTASVPAAATSSPAASAATTPATAAGATRTVDTERGPVEVPAVVESVVAADYYGLYSLVDLGLVPTGITGGVPSGEPYASVLADVPVVGDYVEPFLEPIAALRPDLILRTIDTEDALYDQLSGIAPTVEISFQQLSLKEVMAAIGDAVGRPDEAAALVEQYDAHAATIADAHADTLAATTWVTFSPADAGQWFLLSPAWTDNAVLADAGVQFSSAVVELGEASDDYSSERSLEELSILADADVILVPADATGAIDPIMQPFLDAPLWQALPAVAAGNVFPVPSGTSSLGMGEELLTALDGIIPQVAAVPR